MHKPYTSIGQQVELMQARGIATSPRTKWILEREGYYSVVNGYKDLFLDNSGVADQYRANTAFDDIYRLFVFDRELRFHLFQMLTLAEAELKTICSHEFSGRYRGITNPFLMLSCYAQTVDGTRNGSADRLILIFRKILELDSPARSGSDHRFGRERYGGKSYLRHCMEDHDGEVPMWVLANDLTLGQIYWFYQEQNHEVRKSVARSFTSLYANTHRRQVDVTSERLDKIYRRFKDFRNICAHDERLYCAHPHDRNASVWQVIQDLRFVIDKRRYLEFLRLIERLTKGIVSQLPNCGEGIVRSMGMSDVGDFATYAFRISLS
ncbi:Abi family protein [Bifidobacterium sp. ESL0732]|uniref:Abi family protein n=1 Tax=Bifidobacterium sp. ESL0732 TaxID=2983222 RepID=UPI0023F6F382|nr:Abi family protein [Bifidobacterium sp. ESL0732]WEV63687.1 Abi family protein [Bifidobacterium sp. ESL0732]